MADVRRIIHDILSDPKIATNSNFAGRVYRDEPILITAPQMANYTPPRIREMRKIGKPLDAEAKIFYEQGKFMEDFEDDFDFRGAVVQYFPTYKTLMDAQLRGYFSWRTKLRKSGVEKTSLSFAFLHIYELLNGIGAASPEDGCRALKNFWLAYREIDPRITNYVTLWLKDYVIYHDLDPSFLEGLPDVEFDRASGVLLEYEKHGTDDVFAALNSLSSYNLSKSRFFLQRPEDLKTVAVRVFGVISRYYNRNPKNTAQEKLFGRTVTAGYLPFKSAVFYHRERQRDREYAIGANHKYTCRNGSWQCERFVGYGLNNKKIGDILKTVDCLLRELHGFKSMLQPGKVNKVLRGKIEKEIAQYAAEQKEREARVIDIDISKLRAIRAAALATQEKLLVAEDAAIAKEAAAFPPPSAVVPAAANTAGLNGTEQEFLSSLLRGENAADAAAVAKRSGTLPSVLIDSINDKCYEIFGDTVIAGDETAPEIIEDYRTELNELLKGTLPE